jgi:hypothetical protein
MRLRCDKGSNSPTRGRARCHDERRSWVSMADRIGIAAHTQHHEAESPLYKAWRGRVSRCRFGVKSAVLTFGGSLPVYPEQRTSPDRPGWSGLPKAEVALLRGLLDHTVLLRANN